MYMIITDLGHIFLKPGYTRPLKHEKTILVDISVLRIKMGFQTGEFIMIIIVTISQNQYIELQNEDLLFSHSAQ